jgi:ubiquinone/menaquinone biosynthesis C-methylase UbiE
MMRRIRTPRRPVRLGRAPSTPESQWFRGHFDEAAGEIASFCADCGLSLADLDIADIGCGDGIMALGLCERVEPRRLIGFDIVPTNRDELLVKAKAEGAVRSALPAQLEFRRSTATSTPAGDDEFDFVYSWSAFEHISDPIAVLREIRRILRPNGHFFLQLWPFYLSAKGSHLWDWFDEDYHHLLANDRDIVAELASSDVHPPDWTSYMSGEFEALNRITLEELQRAVLAAGFEVRRLELMTAPTILPAALGRYAWADLAIGGVKLLAVP